jgi:hypothetical protein
MADLLITVEITKALQEVHIQTTHLEGKWESMETEHIRKDDVPVWRQLILGQILRVQSELRGVQVLMECHKLRE